MRNGENQPPDSPSPQGGETSPAGGWGKWLLLLLCAIGLSACQPPTPDASGWQAPIRAAETSPQTRPTLLIQRKTLIFAWHDTTALNVARAGEQPKKLPLGHTPRQWMMYAGRDDQVQVLWLDQTTPDESRLFTALLAPDLTLRRGPTEVSNADTSDFAAAALPSGELQTLWVNRNAGAVPSLYAQRIDSQGRPQTAKQIAKDAVHPALTVDAGGNLHAAWLEAGAGSLWTIHYAQYTDEIGTQPATQAGLIKLDAGFALESFVIGTDATHVYIIWGEADVTEGFAGRVQALSFPMGDPTATVQFAPGDKLRWPSIPVLSASGLAFGLTMFEGVHGTPAIAYLMPGKLAKLITVSEPSGTVGETALAASTDQTLYAAWTAFAENGTTGIYWARCLQC